MNISKEGALIMAAFIIYMGGDFYTTRVAHRKIEKHIEESEQWAAGAVYKLAYMEAEIDSLHIQNKALAKTALYLDSCNQQKTQKADRAERRGKFVGGLLKGLFPGL